MNNKNLILATDSYKASHFQQYPKGTTEVFSYIEARHSKVYPEIKTVSLFGLQAFIQEWLLKPVSMIDVEQAKHFFEMHGEPFNYDGWKYIVEKHAGFLPLTIRAVPEGTPIPIGNMLVSVVSTDENCGWLTSYIETLLLQAVWYGSTVTTISRECKRIIREALDKSTDDELIEGILPFKLHDFGFRGVSSYGSAEMGGAAHLVNFMGTDTIAGILYAMEHYGAGVVGFSIPAAEHSTTTIRGRDNEFDTYSELVDTYAKKGAIFAVVCDSYDLFGAIENFWCDGGLLERVKNAEATVVLRPDSGDPTRIPVHVIQLLADKVGYTVNSKGYKVLPPYVRVIQGDGITLETIPVILDNLLKAGFSAENLGFGMGGGLLQKCDRDTFGFAMKASHAYINGVSTDVYKDPVTDHLKKSKRGLLSTFVKRGGDEYATMNPAGVDWTQWFKVDAVVYQNGRVENNISFDKIRENAKL